MASAESPPATVVENSIQEAPSLPDVPAHEPQPTRSTLPTSSPTTTSDAGERTPEINRTTSLFGPFPPAKEGSHIDQQPGIATGPTQTSGAPPAISTDQIEPPKENRPSATQPSMPALNFDPTAGEPLFSTAANKPTSPKQAAMPALTREKTAPAIGPATDKPTPVPKESEIEGPMLFITLLLTSTGTRHPYKLDEKYLKKRNVVVEGNNPVNISLYKLKELILRDWRDGKKTLQ